MPSSVLPDASDVSSATDGRNDDSGIHYHDHDDHDDARNKNSDDTNDCKDDAKQIYSADDQTTATTTTTAAAAAAKNSIKKESESSSSSGWATFDADDDLTASTRYGLCISAIVPRPVAVITTVERIIDSTNDSIIDHDDKDSNHHNNHDRHGHVNCAPFSYTGLLSHDPAIISHGFVLTADGKKKDTLRNIEATGKWIVHILSTNYVSEANICSTSFPSNVDETQVANLPVLYDTSNGLPRLVDAKVAMECTLWDSKEVYDDTGKHTTTIIMGRVTKFHVHTTVLKFKDNDTTRPLVDLYALQGVGRAGDITYWPMGTSNDTVLSMERPK
jgi:flavin reductase (DIM6/NTAB) family NADH-FMN oxidoreductase RutF